MNSPFPAYTTGRESTTGRGSRGAAEEGSRPSGLAQLGRFVSVGAGFSRRGRTKFGFVRQAADCVRRLKPAPTNAHGTLSNTPFSRGYILSLRG